MNAIGLAGYSLKLIACQHHDLVERVQKLRSHFEQPVARGKLAEAFVEIQAELWQLCRRMDCHFLVEAMEGYLEEAAARLPRLSHEVTSLEHQHNSLMAEIEKLVDMAAESPITPFAWQQLGQRYAVFAEQMLSHEAAEIRLLQEGFNDDGVVFE